MVPVAPEIANIPPWVLFLLLIWSLVWKGLALWQAARHNQRNWFIGLLIFNTLGILEIIYLRFFQKKKTTKR